MLDDVTLVTCTRAEPEILGTLAKLLQQADYLGMRTVIGLDGGAQLANTMTAGAQLAPVETGGLIEAVQDHLVSLAKTEWVLVMADDETMSAAMIEWLAARKFWTSDLWAFPRANLWQDERHYLTNGLLWPDLQTRLSVKPKAGGRTAIHQGSPFGTGVQAPCGILHHKFLCRDFENRLAIARRYEGFATGAGFGLYMQFNLPERAFSQLDTAEVE